MRMAKQPGESTPGGRGDGYLLLLAVAMAIYVVGMGETLAWSHQKSHYWFFLAPWRTPRSLSFLVLGTAFAAAFYWGGARLRRWWPAVLTGLFVGGQLYFAGSAWRILHGSVPWGFDHPSFMFRLKEFGDLFPRVIGVYTPWWNAGIEHYAGVTSGTHGFGMLILPALKLWDPHVFYGAALVLWFIFGFPWLAVVTLRGAGVNWAGAMCGGLLLCGVSRVFFFWMWHYGTVGASVSAMIAVPVVALGYRLAIRGRGGWGTAALLGVCAWIMCLWTPGVVVAAGLFCGWLWNFRTWTWRANRRLLAAGALALALWAPYLWAMAYPASYAAKYFSIVSARPSMGAMLAGGWDRLMIGFQEWHPAILWLGLLGTLGAVPREVRRWMLPVFAGLGLLAGWSREWNPLSQFDRLIIPMAAVAVFPAGILCGRLFAPVAGETGAAPGRARLQALAQGLVLATFVMGLGAVQRHYANQGPARLRTLPPEMREFVDLVQDEVPPEGRLGFAGQSVHSYGGGNIAYLPILAGREMMADDYYGFPPGTAEYNYPPVAYRREIDQWMFFTRAYGITHWAAARTNAQAMLAAHPEHFERIKTIVMDKNPVMIYRVKDAGAVSRFFEGAGRVTARENRIEVHPADPAADRVVIRYNWRNGLVCRTAGASIEPYAVDQNLRFIAVHPGGNERVVIGYRPHWKPIEPNFDGYLHH